MKINKKNLRNKYHGSGGSLEFLKSSQPDPTCIPYKPIIYHILIDFSILVN